MDDLTHKIHPNEHKKRGRGARGVAGPWLYGSVDWWARRFVGSWSGGLIG